MKSWNGAKGFGFIQGSALGADVMFSKRELPQDCKTMVLGSAGGHTLGLNKLV